MVKINLLAWRETQRIEKNRIFYAMLIFALALVSLVLLILYGYYSRKVTQQIVNNQYLQAQTQKLNVKAAQIKTFSTKRKALLAENKLIDNLRAQRFYIVHLFNSIVQALPNGLSLSEIVKEREIIRFVGEAQNNAVISVFMNRLEVTPWFSEPVLSEIKTQTQKPQFVLQVRYRIPTQAAETK